MYRWYKKNCVIDYYIKSKTPAQKCFPAIADPTQREIISPVAKQSLNLIAYDAKSPASIYLRTLTLLAEWLWETKTTTYPHYFLFVDEALNENSAGKYY